MLPTDAQSKTDQKSKRGHSGREKFKRSKQSVIINRQLENSLARHQWPIHSQIELIKGIDKDLKLIYYCYLCKINET